MTRVSAGLLELIEVERDATGGVDGLAQPRWLALSPDGAHLYIASEADNAVSVFGRDPVTGALSFVEQQKDGVGGVDGLGVAHGVTVSPDGAHVYAVGIGDNAIAVFARNATTGALSFVEQQKDGVGGVDGLDAVTSVAVSPDGNHVYTASYFDRAVAVFSRNLTTGALTFVEEERDGVAGVDGLDGAIEVIVSGDGEHLYVAGLADSAVATFGRDGLTGALTYLGVVRDGVAGVDGLNSATSVALSPDGANVYATSYYLDNGIAVFARNGTTGQLSFIEAHKDGVGGVEGLAAATSVTVSPDGAYVIATGFFDDAIAVFERDAGTGALTPLETKKHGWVGVDGLDGASGAIVSPDGANVYVTSENDSAVTVFRQTCIGVPDDTPCDDDDPCTTDTRCAAGLCNDVGAPALGCRLPATPQKALLLLTKKVPDSKNRLTWKWVKGDVTAKADFGTPLTTDDYALCLYDGAGLASTALAPAGGDCAGMPCWSDQPKGFRYDDDDLTPNGVAQIQLKEGLESGKAQVVVKGKGTLLALPELSALSSPVVARLANLATGECWQASYSFPPVLLNDATRFKDRAD